MITHPFPPLYDTHSRILILGSFPSVKSREQMFFYGHPQNRFWRVLAAVFDCAVPETVEEKRVFLLSRRIALWDVLASCEIEGSADSTIKNPIPNDLSPILCAAPITRIYLNGRTAEKYFRRFTAPKIGHSAVCLPSTSPANAAFSLNKLVEAWQIIREEV
ncbi:MAG: DNA-deoxyinosine glycosylase [Clostridia bacterium]|nr:DNA-deoxyinosine glycosylase [Clostridia bacterium]